MKYTGLLDCNNFFVSCERLFRPDLLGRPVVVLSSNDGCVVARSQEVKDMGIPMGIPHFKVKDECKREGVVVFSSNFSLYRDVSARVMAVLRRELGEVAVEQYSIDEAFFSVKGGEGINDGGEVEAANGEDEVLAVGRHLQTLVEREVGIPVSIGIAETKTLAKVAGNIAKKQSAHKGVFWLAPPVRAAVVTPIPVGEIWGVGAQTAQKFHQHNLSTCGTLVAADPARIQTLFGVEGARLQQELSGTPTARSVRERDQKKSIMSSRSFRKATTNLMVLKDAVAYHVQSVAAELREKSLATDTMYVSIRASRYSDFAAQGDSEEIKLPIPTNDTIEMLSAATKAVANMYQKDVPYKKVDVTAGNVVPAGTFNQSLFAENTNQHDELMQAIDGVNKKHGQQTIQIGSYKKESEWQSSRLHRSPHYTTRWDMLAVAKSA